jgi:hypothetical protein
VRNGRRGVDDSGASLLMALGLVTFIGLVIGSLLTYSATSVRATKATDTRAARTYDTDGSLKTAVNQVRGSDFNNEPGTSCPGVSVLNSDGSTATVTCTAGAGTGASSEQVPVTAANRPGQAVLTLSGNAAEPGITQKSGAAFRVQGKVFSSGPVDAGTGTLESVDAQVTAKGTCTGTVVSRNAQGALVPTVCSAAAGLIPADPAYAQPTAGLVYRALPSCGTDSTVDFLPGYYDDAVGLSNMMNGAGACAGKTFLFRPAAGGGVGVYYFDFHNGEGGGLPAGSRVWTVDDAKAVVVGGTPLGWVPDAGTPVVPGSCVSPLRATANNGVQFVFGGDSRLHLKAGSMELCGQYSSTAPPVALYGAKTGADTVAGPATLRTDGTGLNTTGGPPFLDPTRITATDGNPASVLIDATNTPAGVLSTVVVQGFAPPTPIPAGSILTAAKAVIVHRDNNATSDSRLARVALYAQTTRPGGPVLANVPQPLAYQDGATGTAFHTDTLDLLSSLATEVHDNGYVGMGFRYEVAVAQPSKVTENLDSIQVVLTWRPPAVRGETVAVNGRANCVGLYPDGCDLLESEPDTTALVVQGTLYAPYAHVDLRLSGAVAAVFGCGIVVRALQVQITAAASYSGPLIEVPSTSGGPLALELYFRAAVAGKIVGTARVRLPATDPTAAPTAGRRSVSVLSWTIRRT